MGALGLSHRIAPAGAHALPLRGLTNIFIVSSQRINLQERGEKKGMAIYIYIYIPLARTGSFLDIHYSLELQNGGILSLCWFKGTYRVIP